MGKLKIFQSPAFGIKIKKLKKQDKKALDDAVLGVLNDPKIGEEKIGDLSGVFVYKFRINKQMILLSYTFDESEINLLTYVSHENFYGDFKRYKKARSISMPFSRRNILFSFLSPPSFNHALGERFGI